MVGGNWIGGNYREKGIGRGAIVAGGNWMGGNCLRGKMTGGNCPTRSNGIVTYYYIYYTTVLSNYSTRNQCTKSQNERLCAMDSK